MAVPAVEEAGAVGEAAESAVGTREVVGRLVAELRLGSHLWLLGFHFVIELAAATIFLPCYVAAAFQVHVGFV